MMTIFRQNIKDRAVILFKLAYGKDIYVAEIQICLSPAKRKFQIVARVEYKDI